MRRWKWTKWEFWPFWLFYIPVYLFVLLKGFLLRKSTFFLAANPGMPVGGFVEYPKEEILRQFPKKYLPITHLLTGHSDKLRVESAMRELNLKYPVILKPNVGERGYAVEKISNSQELETYLTNAPIDLILQEYVSWVGEYGVMCLRYPWNGELKITSLVIKQPLVVVGDGKKNLLELMESSTRASYHLTSLKVNYAKRLAEILPKGEALTLVEIGNHNRGSTFLDGAKYIDDKLVESFKPLMDDLQGFHIGRFDVKAPDLKSLKEGNFRIIELNGVNSEPAHIYDPQMSIFQGWRDLLEHWDAIFKISRYNLSAGHKVIGFSDLRNLIKKHYRDQALRRTV